MSKALVTATFRYEDVAESGRRYRCQVSDLALNTCVFGKCAELSLNVSKGS